MVEDDVMNLKEVAAYLEFHPMTVYKLVKLGDIPARKIGGQWRFSRRVIDEWRSEPNNQDGRDWI